MFDYLKTGIVNPSCTFRNFSKSRKFFTPLTSLCIEMNSDKTLISPLRLCIRKYSVYAKTAHSFANPTKWSS